jgi:hypothetical protein
VTSGRAQNPKDGVGRMWTSLKGSGPAEVLLYAMILVSPLVVYRLDFFFGVNLSAMRMLVLLAAGMWALRHLLDRDLPRLPGRGVLVVLSTFVLLIAYEVAQLPRTEQPGFALNVIAVLVGGFVIVCTMVLILDDQRKLKLAMLAFLASSAIPIAVGLYQILGPRLGYSPILPFRDFLYSDLRADVFPTMIQGETVLRASSTLAAPAFYGEYIVFVTMFLLALLVYRRFSATWLLVLGILLTLTGFSLLTTIARSAWLLMAVGLAFLVFHVRRDLWSLVTSRSSRWVLPCIVVGMLSLVLVTAFPAAGIFKDSFGSIVWEPVTKPTGAQPGATKPTDIQPNWLRQSTGEHQEMRINAVKVFLQHPVFGVGLGNLGVVTGQGPGISSAHATGFNFLAEGGLMGIFVLLLFMSAFLLSIRRTFLRHRQDQDLRPYLMGLYGSVFLLMLNNTVLYDTLFNDYSWVLLGLNLAAVRVLDKDQALRRDGLPKTGEGTVRAESSRDPRAYAAASPNATGPEPQLCQRSDPAAGDSIGRTWASAWATG